MPTLSFPIFFHHVARSGTGSQDKTSVLVSNMVARYVFALILLSYLNSLYHGSCSLEMVHIWFLILVQDIQKIAR